MPAISVSRARGQNPEYALIRYPGGSIHAGELVDRMKSNLQGGQKLKLPSGMEKETLRAVLEDPKANAVLQELGVPQRFRCSGWVS